MALLTIPMCVLVLMVSSVLLDWSQECSMSEALIKPQSIIYITLGWGIGVKNCWRDTATGQNEHLHIIHIPASINSNVENVWSSTQSIFTGKYENLNYQISYIYSIKLMYPQHLCFSW